MYHGVAGDFSSTDAILSTNSQDFGVINEQYLLSHEDDVFSLNDSCLDENSYFAAPPLHELYRYHVFFSHSSEDRAWVEDIVYRLEAHPFYYKCYFCCTDNFHRRLSIVQSSLCAAMLSERVVIVLTRNYISKTWREFQDILKNLTNMSLYKQRMVIVKVDDCDIPEQLQVLGFMESNDMDFFQTFVRKLRSGEYTHFVILLYNCHTMLMINY